MALSYNFLLVCSLLFFIITPSIAQTSFRPKALVLPVTKDSSTLQYVTQIKQRTPQVPVKLTLDLGGRSLWVNCDKESAYVSSSYTFAPCHSAPCSLANARVCWDCFSEPGPGCHNQTCNLLPDNPIRGIFSNGPVSMDVVSIQSTDGKNPGKVVSVPKLLFVCALFDLSDLAKGVTGMAGLGRSKISLPSLFSSAFSFPRKFSICLSPSTKSNGVVFFGDGPYVMIPGVDVSKSLTYTPLILNPVTTASISLFPEPSSDYFIGVTSIKINGNVVPLNTSLLSIDKKGFGGTKISTVHPYTVMESSIYKAFSKAFIKELADVPRVKAVSPFGACFNSTHIGSTRVGLAVPQIDLVLQSNSVIWRIFGANSMVHVKSDVMCLGFVEGGVNPRTSIVIGGHQLEDNLLQFDLARSRLGLSSSLLFRRTTCSNFNFTSHS